MSYRLSFEVDLQAVNTALYLLITHSRQNLAFHSIFLFNCPSFSSSFFVLFYLLYNIMSFRIFTVLGMGLKLIGGDIGGAAVDPLCGYVVM